MLWFLKPIYKAARRVYQELRHCAGAYRFLRTEDLLIVSGGGQLDEEWGGPWGHPFTLFKWAVLARIAHVPFAIASVGACKLTSKTSRFFVSVALRMAQIPVLSRPGKQNHCRASDAANHARQHRTGSSF